MLMTMLVVMVLQTSSYSQSLNALQQLAGLTAPTTTPTGSSPAHLRPFPCYPTPPILSHIFPPISSLSSSSSSSSSSLLSSSLAYEMLATSALTSFRHVSSLLPSPLSTPTSYDVLSAAAAALLQPPHSGPFPAAEVQSSVERDSSVLDLVVVRGSGSEDEAVVEEPRASAEVKHPPAVCGRDSDDERQSAAAAQRARCCSVWRPY